MAEHWARLGLEPTEDRREIKRAYGRALKAIDPDRDPEAFIALREAYEMARQWGAETPWWDSADEALADGPGDSAVDWEAFGAEDPASLLPALPDEAQWPEMWRPAPPATGSGDGLGEACAELDRVLFDVDQADEETILDAGRAVLGRAELANVDRLAETEVWLAETIHAAAPRSDPLIEPAMARFGWDRTALDWRRPWAIEQVLGRRDDLAFLAACRSGRNRHKRAVEELSGPPRRRLPLSQTHLAAPVADFLRVLAAEHPSVHQDLDAGSVAWWRDYLHGPHLTPSFPFLMTIGPAGITFAAAIFLSTRQLPLAWLLAVLPASALLLFAILKLKAQMDARDRDQPFPGGDGRGGRSVEWLVPAALLLPAAAASLPSGALSTAGSAITALALAAAALTRTWIDPEWKVSLRPRAFLPVLAAILAGIVLALQPPERILLLLPPLALLCWLGSRAFGPVRAWLEDRRRWRSISPPAALLLLAIGIVPLLLTAPDAPPSILLSIPVSIILAHWATAASEADVHWMEWPARVLGMIVWFLVPTAPHHEFEFRLLAAVSTYALIYALVRTLAAFLIEAGRRDDG